MSLKHLWDDVIKNLEKRKSISQFLMLISFLFTFIFIRLITHLQKAHILGNQTGSVHIHHMVPGILLVLFSGFVSISFWSNEKLHQSMAIIFGIGAALTIDEFALWLFLKDVYWAKQGRDSVDAIIVVIVLLIISLVFTNIPIKKLFK